LLIIGTGFSLTYRVLRCAATAGLAACVAGPREIREIGMSRHCAEFFEIGRQTLAIDDAVVSFLNGVAAEREIDMVLPADLTALRLIARVRSRLAVPSMQVANDETIALLNDKWRFYELCRSLSIRCPRTYLFPDREALAEAAAGQELTFPLVIKTTDAWARVGLHMVSSRELLEHHLTEIDYRPLLVQELIAGPDIGLHVIAERGKIVAHLGQMVVNGRHFFSRQSGLLEPVSRLFESLAFDGIANFDGIVAENGEVYVLECNPRFFFSIDTAMIAGVNFVALASGRNAVPRRLAAGLEGISVRAPKTSLSAIAAPWQLCRKDWHLLMHVLSDPLPPLLRRLKKLPEYS
jgi:predicted ATP-grasp superfamily ATP-dependent carboligase